MNPKARWIPRKVFLFSGHMIDAPGRPSPRFPEEQKEVATRAIAALLDRLEAGAQDLALCGGACGGDLIFAQLCLERGVHLQVRIPFEEHEFLKRSVNFAGTAWRERFYKVIEHPCTQLIVMPQELGPTPKGVDPFERNNLWQLDSALAWGAEKVNFIALWDGKPGDGRGGTQHMYETVEKSSGETYIIKTTELW